MAVFRRPELEKDNPTAAPLTSSLPSSTRCSATHLPTPKAVLLFESMKLGGFNLGVNEHQNIRQENSHVHTSVSPTSMRTK